MPTKIGPFEILSELAKSPTGVVYKANDPESGQTIALKAIQLSAFGDSSDALLHALLKEAEGTKSLSSQNITPILGAGEIEGQFCASMEYVQGNSIATMLARKEGFSIWDLLDIGRQLSSGLDHASSKGVVHHSLEPSKIMCGWDGTVRILSFGVSSGGDFAHHVSEGLPSMLHYMSPEQVKGEPLDGRSNLFTLGAIFYEMVTERKAFDRDDIESLRQSILESTPTPPIAVNPKVHPVLSNLILKALAKDPAGRYQTGRELLDDLEKCKETKSVAAKKEAPKGAMAPAKAQAAAQAKFVGATPAKPAAPTAGITKPAPKPAVPVSQAAAKSVIAAPKAAAAAASAGASAAPTSVPQAPRRIQESTHKSIREESHEDAPEIDLSDSFISASVKATLAAAETTVGEMSAAVAEPEIETPEVETTGVETFEPQAPAAPKIAVDPLMAEGGPFSGGGTSFSEINELPPLKEIYVAPPPPEPVAEPVQQQSVPKATMFTGTNRATEAEKAKPQSREVAEKALKEIKTVPPKLMMYSLGAAGVLILAIAVGVTVYIHNQGDDDTGSAKPAPVAENTAPQVSQPEPTKTAPTATAPAATAERAEAEAPEREAPAEPVARHAAAPKKKAPTPVVTPGHLAIDSNPPGASVQLDGAMDPAYVTPLSLSNIQPGRHTIVVSKPGYVSETRVVDVGSGSRASASVQLRQLLATLIVKSSPAGANVYIDGRDSGTRTPAQISVNSGSHVVLVRMLGYLDETMNAQFALGQTFNFTPTLRPLGNADSMHTVGKIKLFGGKGAQAGQGLISIHTNPRGAEIAINQHMLDKGSPVDVSLDPGNYVIDITATGYEPIHKVINVTQGGKVVVDETMQRQ